MDCYRVNFRFFPPFGAPCISSVTEMRQVEQGNIFLGGEAVNIHQFIISAPDGSRLHIWATLPQGKGTHWISEWRWKAKFSLEKATKTQRGSRSLAPLFL